MLNPKPETMYGTTTINNKKCRGIGLNSRNGDIPVQSTMNDCFDGFVELDFAV